MLTAVKQSVLGLKPLWQCDTLSVCYGQEGQSLTAGTSGSEAAPEFRKDGAAGVGGRVEQGRGKRWGGNGGRKWVNQLREGVGLMVAVAAKSEPTS